MPSDNAATVEPRSSEQSGAVDSGILHDLLGHLLRHAFNRGQAVFSEVFEDDGVTPLQFMILELISKNPGIAHSRICTAMGTAASVVTTTMKPLLAAGTVVGRASETDRRVTRYRLSQRGEKWFADLRPKIADCEDRFARSLTDRQRAELIASLKRLSGIED